MREKLPEGKTILLISCDVSSLVIDKLCKQCKEGNAAVAFFYFDFAPKEGQSPAAVLGSVLKQVVAELEDIPERIVRAFQDREKVIGDPKLPLSETVELLQDISISRCIFVCIDALDECPLRYRKNLLRLLNQIHQTSPGVRLFMTGRPHILSEVEERLGGRAATISITPIEDDVITFLRAKLRNHTMPDAMEWSLEEQIMRNIPETFAET